MLEEEAMENPRAEKVALVDEVRTRLSTASAAILTEYRGLTVSELAVLRRALRQAGGEYKIYKNALVRFAVRDLGLDLLEPLVAGPTAIAFVEGDAASVAKALRDFGRTNPHLVVKGGLLGQNVLSAADAGALAELPSRDQLLAQLAGAMAAPLQQFAGLLQALPQNMAYGLRALLDSKGGAPESPEGTEAASPSTAASSDETGDSQGDAPSGPADEAESSEQAEPAATESPSTSDPGEETANGEASAETTESAG
jgi:large subunit ribosomal protein L10